MVSVSSSSAEPPTAIRSSAPVHIRVSEYLAQFLVAQGVTHVYEVVGGMITHLLDALHRDGRVQIVSMHHEQAAGFAAEGMARVSGVPGVAMATSGPGATNLLTAIGSCYFDSTPAVFITGQVNRHEQKGARPIRQLGFQETDIVSMVRPITKAAFAVSDPDQIPDVLASAFRVALEGRRGPVLVDIPMDVQRTEILAAAPVKQLVDAPAQASADSRQDIARLLQELDRAKRPLVLAGGGIRTAGAIHEWKAFVEALRVPVVHSLMAVDVLPWDHRDRVGMIGSYGNRWANLAFGRADLLIVVGSRLDVRQTGSEASEFKGNREIFHVDCDAGEINNRVTGCIPIHADLRSFLTQAGEAAGQRSEVPRYDSWRAEIDECRSEWPDTDELRGVPGINPNVLMHQISRASSAAGAYVVDVGQHQMWAAQSLELGENQRFMTSGGMGAMGFALPAAIGASLSLPNQPVVVIAGDGAFQLNIQELQTVFRNRLPAKIVVIDNGTHGMVRQFQQSYFHERYQSTYWGYSAPDFVRLANAYGISARKVSDAADVPAALGEMWADPLEPFLLQVMVDLHANVYPKLAFGRPITEMEPFAKPIEMEGT